jgi:ABC-type phosphate transport system ATPase subunit
MRNNRGDVNHSCFAVRRQRKQMNPEKTTMAKVEIKKLNLWFKDNNVQQAARVSDFTAFMYVGQRTEYGASEKLFEDRRTN